MQLPLKRALPQVHTVLLRAPPKESARQARSVAMQLPLKRALP
jgi:hypothetical protein